MNAAGGRVAALTKELWMQWQRTRDEWNDSKSREFELKYLQELNANVDRTMMVIEDLDKLLFKIKKDCE